jgi:subtilisin family serine protease
VAAPGDQLVGPMPGGGYAVWSGSSMSSALVSGQAALLRTLDAEASAGAIIDDIQVTARQVPTDPIESGSVDIPRSLNYTIS